MSKEICENRSRPELPSLPRGEGSMSYASDGKIIYKKTITVGGMKQRIGVRGKTPSEAAKLMREKEKTLRRQTTLPTQETLSEALYDWLTRYRKPALKPKSYDRLIITYENQIKPYPLAKIRWKLIKTEDIQNLLNALIDEELSWSTIKKAYDLLNSFFAYQTEHKKIENNPMIDAIMPVKDNILKPEKQITYLKKEEIPIFCEEAYRICKTQNKPYHSYGGLFVLIIYTGIRVGELLALRWKDIDFDNKTMLINKSVEEVINRDYDENNIELMKRKGINRRIQKEGSTKNHASRLIPLNQKAIEALEFTKKYSQYSEPDDYVAATKYGTCNTDHNLYRRLTDILKCCNIRVKQAGCHTLRHTCASLLFANGLPVEIIASILGHSPEVCRKTYIHFCHEQKAAAIHKIAEFNI